jgi:hypothetical protein
VFQKTEGKSTDSIASFSLKRPEYILFYSPISISIFIFSLYSKMVNPILLFLFSVLFIIYYPYQIDGAVQCYACFKNKTKKREALAMSLHRIIQLLMIVFIVGKSIKEENIVGFSERVLSERRL